MKIIALDPGYTTGFCAAETIDDFEVIQVGEFRWDKRHESLMTLLTGKYSPHGVPLTFDVVIIENFRLRPDKAATQVGQTFPSSQLIGITEYICWTEGIPCHVQEPGVRTRVKILDEHAPLVVGSAHKHDAYQHARYYYVTALRGKS